MKPIAVRRLHYCDSECEKVKKSNLTGRKYHFAINKWIIFQISCENKIASEFRLNVFWKWKMKMWLILVININIGYWLALFRGSLLSCVWKENYFVQLNVISKTFFYSFTILLCTIRIVFLYYFPVACVLLSLDKTCTTFHFSISGNPTVHICMFFGVCSFGPWLNELLFIFSLIKINCLSWLVFRWNGIYQESLLLSSNSFLLISFNLRHDH